VSNKLKLDAEDILDIFTFLDENKAVDKLPLFVALDPDLIPSPALAEGDLQCVLGKIANLSDDVDQFIQSQLFTMIRLKSELNDTLNNLLMHHKSKLDDDLLTCSHKTNEINTKVDTLLSCKRASTRPTMAAHTQDKHMTRINQSVVNSNNTADHTALGMQNRQNMPYPLSSTSSFTDLAPSESGDDFTIVENNRHVSRKDNRVTSYAKATASYQHVSTVANSTTTPASRRPPNTTARHTMLGDSTTCTLKASKNLTIKKAVYKISNIDATYEVSDVTYDISTLNVRVVSCFEIAPSS